MNTSIRLWLLQLAFILFHCATAFKDTTTDWVNPRYVLQKGVRDTSTVLARQWMSRQSSAISQNGPWTITATNISAPSNDVHDYLSWAPYHWPDCRYCDASSGAKHNFEKFLDQWDASENSELFVQHASLDNFDTEGELRNVDLDEDECDDYGMQPSDDLTRFYRDALKRGMMDLSSWFNEGRLAHQPDGLVLHLNKFSRNLRDGETNIPTVGLVEPIPTAQPPRPLDEPLLPKGSLTPTSSERVASNNPSGAEAIQKTKTNKKTSSGIAKPTKTTASSQPSCISHDAPPRATWTSCPYKTQDGRVNPDTKQLPNINALNSVTRATLYSTFAYVFSGQNTSLTNAVSFINIFFLKNETAMNPNMDYGQVVRGPQAQMGGYTGILDMRVVIQVVNSILLLRSVPNTAWTPELDKAMVSWAKVYVRWLQTSDLGKHARSAANNHGTFYAAQLAALQILVGDKNATSTIRSYFAGPFQEQITASGEQPLEAVRTRPYHYRCFNLEAMLLLAKLGDFLGVDFWTTRTKYGATIQGALNFVTKQDPKSEDVGEVLPHVAAVAAAYGDPQGQYSSFLQRNDPSFNTRPFWFYDQQAAFTMSPAAGAKVRRDDSEDSLGAFLNKTQPILPETADASCPAVFRGQQQLELDQDLYVVCADLREFYSRGSEPDGPA